MPAVPVLRTQPAGRGGQLGPRSGPSPLAALLHARRAQHGTTAAFIAARGTRRPITWQEIAGASEEWDRLLVASGAPVGALIGLALSDPLDFTCAFLAIMAARRWVVPIDAGAPAASRHRTWANLPPDAVLADDRLQPGPIALPEPSGTGPAPRVPRALRDHGGVVLASSGTTGSPKVVALDQHRLLHTARMVVDHHGIRSSDRVHNVLPLFHVNAEVVVVLSTVLAGASAVLDDRFHRRRFWATVSDHGVTWVNAVPAVIARLCQPDPAGNDSTALQRARRTVRFIRSASAPLPAATRGRFESCAGLPVVESYGMTEAGSQICAVPVDDRTTPGSVGRPVGVELRIRESGRPCPPGIPGGIEIRGPGVITEYCTPADNARIGADRWLATGDLGYTDERGNVFLVGRRDDVINRGGEKLAPSEVEEVLAGDEDVEAVVVVGQPDQVLGQVPVAYVTLRHGSTGVDQVLARFRDRSAAALPAPKRPTSISVLAAMPVGPTGKIQRRRLLTPQPGGVLGALRVP